MKMEIREDICFTNEKGEKSYANASKHCLFLHPKRIEENIKKIEKVMKENCPKFYGEIEKGKNFIMEHNEMLFILNHQFEIEDRYVEKHFNGKIFIRNNKIVNNQNAILFDNVEEIHTENNYSIFNVYKTPINILITKEGFVHPFMQYSSEIVSLESEFSAPVLSESFFQYFERWTGRTDLENPKLIRTTRIIYDLNGNIICSGYLNDNKTKEIIKRHFENNLKVDNFLEEKRTELYQKMLYAQFKKKFQIDPNTNEHYIQTITNALCQNEKGYIFDLYYNYFCEGKMKDCFELISEDKEDIKAGIDDRISRNEVIDLVEDLNHIENIQILEEAVEEYKRERVKK